MNLAKLFKLPKKLGDSLLISLINNMVDYLRTYDNVIKVDDYGGVHLDGNDLYLEGNGGDIDIEADSEIFLSTLNGQNINLNSSGSIYLESSSSKNITLNSSNSIYLNSNDNIELSSESAIALYTSNENNIELNSDGSVYLTTNNGYSIELESNGGLYLSSNGDIDLVSNTGEINLYSDGDVKLKAADNYRILNIWSDDDGLEYTQDDEIFFQIDGDGKIHGKTIEKTINVMISNATMDDCDFELVFYSEGYNESETLAVDSEDSNTTELTISYPNYNPNGYLKVSINGGGFKGSVVINPNYENIIFNIDNSSLNNFIIPINFELTNDITINLYNNYCYTADTLITLADGSTKQVKDITYDDELKVWNFDEGKDDVAKPLWIKRTEYAKSYQLVTLSDGNTIKLCGSDGKYHCMFDVTEQKFNHAVDCIGHEVYTENGIATVVSIEEVKEKVDHYNIVTNYHMNLYANHILTSTEKNNIYPIADMKFVKNDREIVPYEEFEKAHISREYYDGWRAGEWSEPLKDVITHLRRRKMYAKPQKRVKDGLRTDYFG